MLKTPDSALLSEDHPPKVLFDKEDNEGNTISGDSKVQPVLSCGILIDSDPEWLLSKWMV